MDNTSIITLTVAVMIVIVYAGYVYEKKRSRALHAYFESHKGLTVEGKYNMLLLYRYNSLIKPDEVPSFLTEGVKNLRLFEEG